jgi:hypothetical protein
MTVAELIAELGKLPQDAEVKSLDDDGWIRPISEPSLHQPGDKMFGDFYRPTVLL